MMTMCSTSAIVPVREFAGIDSARLMLAGKAAETAPLMSSWRNVRRSVVITKASIGDLFRSRDESVTFSRIFRKNWSGRVRSTSWRRWRPYCLAESERYRAAVGVTFFQLCVLRGFSDNIRSQTLLNPLFYNFGFPGSSTALARNAL
jgi:hypothetical protein